MATPLRLDARARLRAQIRVEQDLAARVLAADARLTAASRRRDAALAAHDRTVGARRGEVADALADYLELAGVGLDRAAAVLGRDRAYLARLVRERRTRRGSSEPA